MTLDKDEKALAEFKEYLKNPEDEASKKVIKGTLLQIIKGGKKK